MALTTLAGAASREVIQASFSTGIARRTGKYSNRVQFMSVLGVETAFWRAPAVKISTRDLLESRIVHLIHRVVTSDALGAMGVIAPRL